VTIFHAVILATELRADVARAIVVVIAIRLAEDAHAPAVAVGSPG